MNKPKSSKKNARLAIANAATKNSFITTRLPIFPIASAFVFFIANWICRLGVINPGRWLPAANFARWFLIAICLYLSIINALMMIMPWAIKSHPSIPPENKPLSFFIYIFFNFLSITATLILLIKINLFAALILTSLTGWIKVPHNIDLARKERDRKRRRIKFLDVPISLLCSLILISALVLDSLSLAAILFALESVQFLIGIPVLKEQIRLKR